MFNNKKVLVVGMARSGIAAVECLYRAGAQIVINDSKSEAEIKDEIKAIIDKVSGKVLGCQPSDLGQYDYVVLSPGVPTHLPFILEAKALNVPVIGELELGYLLTKGTFYGITGTNGKTTTTTLTNLIFKEAGLDAYAVGNIGKAIASVSHETDENSHLITEVSSFQLESVKDFNVHIAAVLNLAPDHLNRHKTMENYIDAKCRLFQNQKENDFLILNYDDLLTRDLAKRKIKSKVLYFSRTKELDEGLFVRGEHIIAKFETEEVVMPLSDIFILGNHSLENVLAAASIAYLAGITAACIAKAVSKFTGVEHRIEYVGNVLGVDCYNDSKGTNPESSIVAVNSMTKPTVLIAGGLDKGSVFDEFVRTFEGKLKSLVLLGDTKEIIKETALKYGFKDIVLVATMEEAVDFAFENCVEGDALSLSPACASWDMYESFEVRGEHFKTCVLKRIKG